MPQLEDNIKALELKLSAQDLSRLDEITKPTLIFPHNMMPMFPSIHNGGTSVNGVHAEPSAFGVGEGEKAY